MTRNYKVLLISIDGWGISDKKEGNAIFNAKTPFMDELSSKKDYYTTLGASGLDVGLPRGVMGNSEVGHLTMGAGRQIFTDLVKINMALENNTLGENKTLIKAFNLSKERGKKFHLLGLLSDGGVHSHIDHLFEIIRLAKENNVPRTYIHAFMDGRDTSPTSGPTYIRKLMEYTSKIKYGKLSTMIGRYYAMDRDERWDRIEKAYDLLVGGKGENAGTTPEEIERFLKSKYKEKIFDEMMEPAIVLNGKEGKISDGDVLLFFDFRSDRMRQIVKTLGIQPCFEPKNKVMDVSVFQMTQYDSEYDLPVVFPPEKLQNVIAEWVSKKKKTQYHIAETEKYAHVTFFFNGGSEVAYIEEDRKLIQSPNVKTYDLQPQMSMPEVADGVVEAMKQGYDFVMCNFAPPDMVGHTGNYEATVKAVEETDRCIERCVNSARSMNYASIVTSDHGNAEEMIDEKGNPKTSHNCNRVPLCLVMPGEENATKLNGNKSSSLKDVAPTICALMGLEIPTQMTGVSLLKD